MWYQIDHEENTYLLNDYFNSEKQDHQTGWDKFIDGSWNKKADCDLVQPHLTMWTVEYSYFSVLYGVNKYKS